jgi:hypothetical protein
MLKNKKLKNALNIEEKQKKIQTQIFFLYLRERESLTIK